MKKRLNRAPKLREVLKLIAFIAVYSRFDCQTIVDIENHGTALNLLMVVSAYIIDDFKDKQRILILNYLLSNHDLPDYELRYEKIQANFKILLIQLVA